jgi:Zn-dependent peptidase ImmA (M78 family)/transcriptional regulator with XRE-family HTH domain
MDLEFNGAELRLARIFNGLALEEVAERVEKTRQYLHRLETGQATPTEQLLRQLASVLQVEPSFLTNGHTLMIEEDQFHFRKLFTTRAMIKQVAMARGELIGRLVTYLDRELKLPDVRIPAIDNVRTVEDIERAAELCRREWELGLGPITNMNRLAENVGAIVTSFQSVSKEIDALSVAVQRPIIVRNEAKESVCRQRFDIGHELGHFVLHPGMTTGDRVTEGQANRFASALLIPRTMMAKLFPRPRGSRLDWVGLREFKLTWKVSKAAILYRARQLELISDDQYKTGVITLRRTGEAAGEKEDHLISPEVPELLSRSLAVLAEKKAIYAEEIASALRVMPNLVREVIGFDIPMRASSQNQPLPRRAGLYLVT